MKLKSFCTAKETINKMKRQPSEDGGRVRHGDHLPSHKYIRNTSTCGTTPTEHLLNAGKRPQNSQKARNSLTYLGRAKEKRKQGQKNRDGTCTSGGGAVKEERFPHTRKPLRRRRLRVVEGGSFGVAEESAAIGVQRAKRRDSRTEDWCRPGLTSLRGLSAHPPGRAGAGS